MLCVLNSGSIWSCSAVVEQHRALLTQQLISLAKGKYKNSNFTKPKQLSARRGLPNLLPVLEVLNRPLVLLRFFSRGEGSQVSPLACLFIGMAAIDAKLTGFELPNHPFVRCREPKTAESKQTNRHGQPGNQPGRTIPPKS